MKEAWIRVEMVKRERRALFEKYFGGNFDRTQIQIGSGDGKVGIKTDIFNSGNSFNGILFTEIGNATRGQGGDHGKILQA